MCLSSIYMTMSGDRLCNSRITVQAASHNPATVGCLVNHLDIDRVPRILPELPAPANRIFPQRFVKLRRGHGPGQS